MPTRRVREGHHHRLDDLLRKLRLFGAPKRVLFGVPGPRVFLVSGLRGGLEFRASEL